MVPVLGPRGRPRGRPRGGGGGSSDQPKSRGGAQASLHCRLLGSLELRAPWGWVGVRDRVDREVAPQPGLCS